MLEAVSDCQKVRAVLFILEQNVVDAESIL